MRPEKREGGFDKPQRPGTAGCLADLQDHVRDTYCRMTARDAVRAKLNQGGRDWQIDKARSEDGAPTSALGQLLAQLKRIHAAGGSYAELQQATFLVQAFVNCLAGATPRALDKLDLDEERVSAQEDCAQMGRRVQMLRGALQVEQLEQERGFRLERAGLDLEFVQALDLAIAAAKAARPAPRLTVGVA